MQENYFQHPAYDQYPVVNLTMDDIVHYLRWKTAKYGNYRNDSVVFRLPNEDEWKDALFVLPGSEFPWEGTSMFVETRKGVMAQANLKAENPALNIMADGGLFQTAVESYPPNNRGLYQMIGNVAELTYEGLIKGGSWNNYLAESGVHSVQQYQLPHPCVGFRVLAVVYPREK
jgi:formylglycine-generating enzyme required for sulfatase activity